MKELFFFGKNPDENGNGYSKTVKWVAGAAALIGSISVLFGATVWALKSAFPTHDDVKVMDIAQKKYHDDDLLEKFDAEHKLNDLQMKLLAAQIAERLAVIIEKSHHGQQSNAPGSEKIEVMANGSDTAVR